MIDQNERDRPYKTIKKALELFHDRQGCTIVEIGSMRQPLLHDLDDSSQACCNDGHSSIHWARAAKNFFSVDINPECTAITQQSLQAFGYLDAHALTADGLQFLTNFGETIDLLYLDAWDVGTTEYSERHLDAYRAAKPWLHEKSIILIDDTDIEWDGREYVISNGLGGKGKLLVSEAVSDGFQIVSQGRQVLLARLTESDRAKKTSEPRRVLVEGWRFVPHSYAFVMAGIVSELCYKAGLDVRFLDRPYFRSHWKPVNGTCSNFTEKALANLANPEPGWQPNYVLRFDFPMRLTPVDGAKTIVFGTTELGQLLPQQLADQDFLDKTELDSSVTVMTPSMWSRRGFIEAGIPSDQVVVIPLGVEPELFFPLPDEERNKIRKKLGWEGKYVVLNIGGASGNKGIPVLLNTIAQIAKKNPHVYVCLKGLDSLYESEKSVLQNLDALQEDDREIVKSRLIYLGETLSIREMATLYQAADLYFSPYHAEGFNMPALEAAACGLPIVCTGGGSTDDFVDGRFARRIESHLKRGPEGKWYLEPDLSDAVSAIQGLIDDKEFSKSAREIGPKVVRSSYSWSHAADKLLGIF